MHVVAIILAAGSSSRMGQQRNKLLLPLGSRPVLVHVIEAALTSQAQAVLVVLGHQAVQVRASIAAYTNHPALTLVDNPDYQEGMSTSLRVGIQAGLTTTPPCSAALVLLGDQPLITSQSIDALIQCKQATGKRIVAPLYNGKRGNPVLFDASLFPELLEVTGDEGGRRIIERYQHELATVELDAVSASYDVDTWEAYQQVLAMWDV
jgi:molybdenum cofactor cytidylyltransferase